MERANLKEAQSHPSGINADTKLLQETIVKIEGAYAPSTIRAYRADFNDFINFCPLQKYQGLTCTTLFSFAIYMPINRKWQNIS